MYNLYFPILIISLELSVASQPKRKADRAPHYQIFIILLNFIHLITLQINQ